MQRATKTERRAQILLSRFSRGTIITFTQASRVLHTKAASTYYVLSKIAERTRPGAWSSEYRITG